MLYVTEAMACQMFSRRLSATCDLSSDPSSSRWQAGHMLIADDSSTVRGRDEAALRNQAKTATQELRLHETNAKRTEVLTLIPINRRPGGNLSDQNARVNKASR